MPVFTVLCSLFNYFNGLAVKSLQWIMLFVLTFLLCTSLFFEKRLVCKQVESPRWPPLFYGPTWREKPPSISQQTSRSFTLTWITHYQFMALFRQLLFWWMALVVSDFQLFFLFLLWIIRMCSHVRFQLWFVPVPNRRLSTKQTVFWKIGH